MRLPCGGTGGGGSATVVTLLPPQQTTAPFRTPSPLNGERFPRSHTSRVVPLNRKGITIKITSYDYEGTFVILIVIRNRNRICISWLRLIEEARSDWLHAAIARKALEVADKAIFLL